ncbi:hypothetical protein [Legionella jordanis]|uniref:Uncharacterized protein n=1 Tax=Legionella jordanis TaxID=456 RepID=A0A0W0VBQ0_9GAMM|nr:hypothetical protein [Legionella jordanis]KTD17564.1 hypothetical protein Ljor_1870 [Legionella jordanis]RMX05100.1 hypothetical protein EAW55_00075 [Legionella jordanis]RMX17356.1 hypothetical protein EAS68_10705 [Legionella jordanis]VEH13533.1 Uncharacterised protein [Legionella jordanis]HAT8714449.1 hypothetical protein [Legionella jordanis]
MGSFEQLVFNHPYFTMLVFVAIGFLLRGLMRVNIAAVKINIEELELALQDEDIEKAKYSLQRLKSGFGFH